MSGSRPVGRRHSPAVYRRRRLVVGLAAVTLVGAPTAWAVSAVAGSDGDAGPATDVDASATSAAEGVGPEPTSGATSEATAESTSESTSGSTAESTAEPLDGACAPDEALVAVTPDATTYALGSTATFALTITGAGSDPCALDVGGAALELVVSSGSDRIWSSDDCQQGAASEVYELAPGEELVSETPWPLERSAPGCAEGLPDLRPGTYKVTGRVGTLTSEAVTLQVTG